MMRIIGHDTVTSFATLIHDTLFAALRFVSPRFLDDPHPCTYPLFSVYICAFLPYTCLSVRILSESIYARCFFELPFHHLVHILVAHGYSVLYVITWR